MLVNTGYTSNNIIYMNTYKNSNIPKFDTEKLVDKNKVNKNEAAKEETSASNYDEKAFYTVGPNAPENVKKAWMETAREVGSNGLGMLPNGMIGHLSQMMVQRVVDWHNGKADFSDILGNTVESAIQATEQALFNLDNPLSPNIEKSIEVQQLRMKEREFYKTFLDKLYSL